MKKCLMVAHPPCHAEASVFCPICEQWYCTVHAQIHGNCTQLVKDQNRRMAKPTYDLLGMTVEFDNSIRPGVVRMHQATLTSIAVAYLKESTGSVDVTELITFKDESIAAKKQEIAEVLGHEGTSVSNGDDIIG